VGVFARQKKNAPDGAFGVLRLLAGRNVALGLGVVLAGEELVHLLLQELAVLGVHHVQAAFVDQHGLVFLPVFPGFFGNVVVDVFAFCARIGWAVESGEFFFVFSADHGAGHEISPAFSSAAARLSSVFTGAASPSRGGVARLYQSQSASATASTVDSTLISQGSMVSWKWLKVWVRSGSSRCSRRVSAWRSARGARALRSSSSGRLQSPPQSPVGGRR